MNRGEIAVATLTHGIGYNFVEVTLIAIIAGVHLTGGEVWSWVLWLGFAAAALWTVLASVRDAQEEAEQMSRDGLVFVSDFLLGAFFLLVLSTMTMQYGLQFGAIFFVAAIQNLRYSAMAYDWLQEENKRDDSKRDNLP